MAARSAIIDQATMGPVTGAAPSCPRAADPARVRRLPHYLVDLFLIDVAAAALASVVAYWLRFGFDQASISFLSTAVPYGMLSLLLVGGWVALLHLGGCYDRAVVGFGSEEYRRVVDVGLRLVAAVAIISFAFKLELARGFVAALIPFTVASTIAGRWWSRRWLHRVRRTGSMLLDVLTVGPRASLADLDAALERHPEAGFRLVGHHDLEAADERVLVAGVVDQARHIGAGAVAVAGDADLSPWAMRSLAWQLTEAGVELMVTPRLSDLVAPKVTVRPVSGVPLLHLEQPRIDVWGRLVKGAFDRVAALAALVVLAPLLALIAVAIRRTSEGPVVFRQQRLGRDGRWFTVYKFRTMTVSEVDLHDENEVGGLLFKMRQDPRITPLGAWLRRWSLDELPQLWNVLKGDMSVVGPRPLPDGGADEDLESTARRRMLVKPGLTGLWQISGRSDLSWEESIRLDLQYVEGWSLTLDAVIVLKTFAAVLRGKGAY